MADLTTEGDDLPRPLDAQDLAFLARAVCWDGAHWPGPWTLAWTASVQLRADSRKPLTQRNNSI